MSFRRIGFKCRFCGRVFIEKVGVALTGELVVGQCVKCPGCLKFLKVSKC